MTTTRGIVATVATASALVIAAVAPGMGATTEVIRDHPVVHGVIAKATGRACEQEDSVNCFGNAHTMGNGVGHSFYRVKVGHSVCTIYWNTRFNRRHGRCAS